MSTRQSFVDSAVADRLAQARDEREIERRLDLIEAFGKDDYTAGTVFRFVKQFDDSGTVYSYAAIKAGNSKWYTTGKMVYGTDWEDFVLWLVSGKFPVEWTELELMITVRDMAD